MLSEAETSLTQKHKIFRFAQDDNRVDGKQQKGQAKSSPLKN